MKVDLTLDAHDIRSAIGMYVEKYYERLCNGMTMMITFSGSENGTKAHVTFEPLKTYSD